MSRDETFQFRISPSDRKRLEKVAKTMKRNKSDAIRVLVSGVLAEIRSDSSITAEEAIKRVAVKYAT